jgi:hypothetical protein
MDLVKIGNPGKQFSHFGGWFYQPPIPRSLKSASE